MNNLNQSYQPASSVCAHLNIGRSTLWRLAQLDGFPTPLKVGRAVRYRLDEIEAFLRRREG